MSEQAIDDGGPAFPCQPVMIEGVLRWPSESDFGGMSLRDYFAANVAISDDDYPDSGSSEIVGRERPDCHDSPLGWLKWYADLDAIIRGIKADAMIRERKRTQPAA